jgi:hypothetical protein
MRAMTGKGFSNATVSFAVQPFVSVVVTIKDPACAPDKIFPVYPLLQLCVKEPVPPDPVAINLPSEAL